MRFEDFLYYDLTSKTGLRWKVKRNNSTLAGDEAGVLDNTTGYYRVGFNNKLYYCHRVIWIINNGDIEDGYTVDHIDGNKLNNDINNIRVITQGLNLRNRKINTSSKSGVTGVYFDKYSIKPAWVAHWYELDGKRKSKRFGVKVYGDENAFILAWEYRKKMIKLLNDNGAGYTDRHGKIA